MATITKNLGRVVGADGQDGRGISKIVKTATSGLVDTYTIIYTDGTTSTYTVTNGLNGSGDSQVSYLKTLKCGVLGDSITYGAGVNTKTECYPMLLKEDFKEVINYGISATLVAKDDSYPNPMCERYVNMADDLDVIIVMGGTNDFAVGSRKEESFGEPTSTDPYTFYGALNILMSGLIEKYPGKEIFFCTPIHIAYSGYTSDTTKANGKTLYDYRNAIIERGLYYSIPVIDTMGASGMDIAHNSQARTLFTTDGCHPNANGHKRLHDRIIHAIKNMMDKQIESEEPEIPDEPDTPTATLESISAFFTQGNNVIYTTDSLDELKQYLVVNAIYDDGTSQVVTNYALSGTLTEGTSTITVTYSGFTTTFTVDVTYKEEATLESISAVFDSGDNVIYTTDDLNTLKQYLTVTAIYSDETSKTITNYTLSGELNEGSNIITVSYNGKTTTFEVEVEALPYTLYNSLTSDSDSYINTGVMANQDTKFEIKFNLNDATTSGSAGIGVLATYSNNNTALFGLNTFQNTTYYSYGEQYLNFTLSDKSQDKVATNNKGTLVINGEEVVNIGDKTFTQNHPLYMFALNNNGRIEYKANRLKIYYCKIWDGDTLIRDFVPAKRGTDNAIGMLDRVNNVFYTNQGTGTFTGV